MKRLREYATPLITLHSMALDILMLSGAEGFNANFDYDDSGWL